MVGILTPDRTYVWLDARGRIQTAGPQARHWRNLARGKHWLIDLDTKNRLEREAELRGEMLICDPCDILRRIRSFGELAEVMRRIAPGCQEYVEVPPAGKGDRS